MSDGWNRIPEVAPPEGEAVLVAEFNGSEYNGLPVSARLIEGVWHVCWDGSKFAPDSWTHWHPLPEAPK